MIDHLAAVNFCPDCGIEAMGRFCHKCGRDLSGEPLAPEPKPSPPDVSPLLRFAVGTKIATAVQVESALPSIVGGLFLSAGVVAVVLAVQGYSYAAKAVGNLNAFLGPIDGLAKGGGLVGIAVQGVLGSSRQLALQKSLQTALFMEQGAPFVGLLGLVCGIVGLFACHGAVPRGHGFFCGRLGYLRDYRQQHL